MASKKVEQSSFISDTVPAYIFSDPLKDVDYMFAHPYHGACLRVLEPYFVDLW
jgi:hypothetical protein